MPHDQISLTGTLQRIVYSQPESGFLIGRFLVDDTETAITVKGTVLNVGDHETLKLKGRWHDHPTYGRQFEISEFMPVQPTSLEGMERYLASGAFKHIGAATAQKIVAKFREDTFEIIDRDPQALLRSKVLNRKQFKSLTASWGEQRELREVMSFLHGLGISASYAKKIHDEYGLSSVATIQDNPYRLTEVAGIGFLKADGIARRLGFDENSPERAVAGLLYMLDQQALNGHTCYPEPELAEQTSSELRINSDVIAGALQQLRRDRLVKAVEPEEGNQQPTLLARPKFYYAEQRIAENFTRILSSKGFTDFPDPAPLIAEQEQRQKIRLDPVQREAVEAALQHKVLIITGGPGTGKTTIIRFILMLLRPHIPAIALAAPTGRAAKRLAEATGAGASTIHRLLEANNFGFQRNRDEPLEQELLVLDESSMIDTLLMDVLLDAIPSQSRLVLVGDVDQLPSVGAGAILLNCIECGQVPVVRLEHIYRQGEGSRITLNAHAVRQGQLPELERVDASGPLRDFYFIREPEPEQVVEKILALASTRIPERFGMDPLFDIQVITPMHRGATGTINLNARLQAVLNPDGKGLEFREREFWVRDKVMQQQNNYDKEVFNGDMGVIVGCDPVSKNLHVKFDQEVVEYEGKELEQLALAYAISVHKSQGSEYPAVVMPLTTHHYVMLQRNLLYTALTRGKQLVILVGTEQAVKLAVLNDQTLTRHTLLPHEFAQTTNLKLALES